MAAALSTVLLVPIAIASDGLSTPPLRMLDWTDRPGWYVAASSQPATCLASTSDAAATERIARGAVLFQSPTLLGGQAARGRLSCASCHNNGRDNPHFFLGGISQTPGTADVTSSFFGTARANGRFDPVRIPDLGRPGRIARDRSNRDLERFIRTLIVDEFSGTEPDSASLDAVSAYVRAIRPCADQPDDGRVPIDLDDQLRAVRDGVGGAMAMARAGDGPAARQMIAATRHQLGLIAERYRDARPGRIGSALAHASQRLAAIEPTAAAADTLALWLIAFDRDVVPRLERGRTASLYAPDRLRRTLAAQPDNRQSR